MEMTEPGGRIAQHSCCIFGRFALSWQAFRGLPKSIQADPEILLNFQVQRRSQTNIRRNASIYTISFWWFTRSHSSRASMRTDSMNYGLSLSACSPKYSWHSEITASSIFKVQVPNALFRVHLFIKMALSQLHEADYRAIRRTTAGCGTVIHTGSVVYEWHIGPVNWNGAG